MTCKWAGLNNTIHQWAKGLNKLKSIWIEKIYCSSIPRQRVRQSYDQLISFKLNNSEGCFAEGAWGEQWLVIVRGHSSEEKLATYNIPSPWYNATMPKPHPWATAIFFNVACWKMWEPRNVTDKMNIGGIKITSKVTTTMDFHPN